MIATNKVVTMEYQVYHEGVLKENEHMEYLHGDYDNIVPGLHKHLEGKNVGYSTTITLAPEDAYGEYDSDDTEIFDKSDLPGSNMLEVNMIVVLEDEDGYEFEAKVVEVMPEQVKLDFNPPLAGKICEFHIEILDIRDATEAEIEAGFPEEKNLWEDEDDD